MHVYSSRVRSEPSSKPAWVASGGWRVNVATPAWAFCPAKTT